MVTNIDKEHIDFYKNFNNLKNSFIKFLNKTPAAGKAFVCIDDYQLKKIIPKINKKNFFTYGFSTRANFQIFNAGGDENNSTKLKIIQLLKKNFPKSNVYFKIVL